MHRRHTNVRFLKQMRSETLLFACHLLLAASMEVPEGHPKIARHFSGGSGGWQRPSPGGTADIYPHTYFES
jgi:hypothetical protein